MSSREGAGPSADKAPIAWSDHSLAASGGEILVTRILPLMGHDARDFARAAAVCPGWRAACRVAAATVSVYREAALQPSIMSSNFAWSPCGKFYAAAVPSPPRIFIWRASTGALMKQWALATAATAVHRDFLEKAEWSDAQPLSMAFSRDSTRLLTLFPLSDHFAVWSVPDGQLVAVNKGSPNGGWLSFPDFGVPGSASDGLVGFLFNDFAVELWALAPAATGGVSRPRRRARVQLAPEVDEEYIENMEDDGESCDFSFAFSPNGSKFAVATRGKAYVYDIASRARIATFAPPWESARAAWTPGGQRVLVSCGDRSCVWDFTRRGSPPVVTADVDPDESIHGPDVYFNGWSPSGASYFVTRALERARGFGPAAATFALEERRTADGALLRAVNFRSGDGHAPMVALSPDSHAALIDPSRGVPARLVLFG